VSWGGHWRRSRKNDRKTAYVLLTALSDRRKRYFICAVVMFPIFRRDSYQSLDPTVAILACSPRATLSPAARGHVYHGGAMGKKGGGGRGESFFSGKGCAGDRGGGGLGPTRQGGDNTVFNNLAGFFIKTHKGRGRQNPFSGHHPGGGRIWYSRGTPNPSNRGGNKKPQTGGVNWGGTQKNSKMQGSPTKNHLTGAFLSEKIFISVFGQGGLFPLVASVAGGLGSTARGKCPLVAVPGWGFELGITGGQPTTKKRGLPPRGGNRGGTPNILSGLLYWLHVEEQRGGTPRPQIPGMGENKKKKRGGGRKTPSEKKFSVFKKPRGCCGPARGLFP